jgi:HEAT repeat protein
VPAPNLAPPPQASAYTPVAARQDEVDGYLQQLANGDDRGRADAAIRLGRLHAARAVEALTRSLEQDRCPAVRDAAARALGLIASPSSLGALQRAAQADDDRDVRHSAGFAAEVIRANR